MATYPALPMIPRITQLGRSNHSVAGSGGTVRSIDDAQPNQYRIELQHPNLQATQLATLLAFYEANRDLVVDIDLDGKGLRVFDCLFDAEPRRRSRNNTRFDVFVTLTGTRQ